MSLSSSLTTRSNNPHAKRYRRKIVVLNFLRQGETREHEIGFGDCLFEVKDFCIGWDYQQAAELIDRFDAEVDGFVLAGVREGARFAQTECTYRKTRELMRRATRAAVYVGTDLQTLFANWTIRRSERANPGLFKGKSVLFHISVFTPYSETILDLTHRVAGADSLLLNIPVKLVGRRGIESFLKLAKPLIVNNLYYRVDFTKSFLARDGASKLHDWIRDSEVFVTYSSLMKTFEDFSCFKDRIVLIDSAPQALRQKLIQAGVAQIIEFMPDMAPLTDFPISSFGLLNALIDQYRIVTQSHLSLSAFTLELIEKMNIQPRQSVVVKPPIRRCAFVIHPLNLQQMLAGSGFGFLRAAPKNVHLVAERVLSHLPVFEHGQVIGAKSELTGQEVICDLFAIAATPRELMTMNEDRLYDRLVKAAHLARDKGALLMGLGAYTKVAGDAGVTVARRSPIPITTGNSYSAAATLWAAKVMVEKMLGYDSSLASIDGQPLQRPAKAMVIGATGSIGRVSSLLLAEVFKEIVLVATRADKLLELKDEILASHPQVEVRITTSPNVELRTTDLVVTATSSRGEKILDIMEVKPGAVICDCSRPLDISAEEAALRPDVMVIESGEIDLPGVVKVTKNIGLPEPSVYACLAETVLLTMEGCYESFSLSRTLNLNNVKEIYRIGRKHGAKLSAIHGYNGVVTAERIEECKRLAAENLKTWQTDANSVYLDEVRKKKSAENHQKSCELEKET